jgi:hypothetical protein
MRAQRWEDAVATCQNAVRHAQQNGDTASQAHALLHQGRVSHLLHQSTPRQPLPAGGGYFHLLARDTDEAVALIMVGDLGGTEHVQEALFNYQQAQALVERLLARQQNAGSVTLSAQYAKRLHFLQRRIDSMAARASRDLTPLTLMISGCRSLQLPPPGQPVEPAQSHGRRGAGGADSHRQARVRCGRSPAGGQLPAGGRRDVLRGARARDGGPGRTRADDYVLVRRATRTAERSALAAAWKDVSGLFFALGAPRGSCGAIRGQHPEIIGGRGVDVLGYRGDLEGRCREFAAGLSAHRGARAGGAGRRASGRRAGEHGHRAQAAVAGEPRAGAASPGSRARGRRGAGRRSDHRREITM